MSRWKVPQPQFSRPGEIRTGNTVTYFKSKQVGGVEHVVMSSTKLVDDERPTKA